MLTSNTNGKRKMDSCDDKVLELEKDLQMIWDSTAGRGWNPDLSGFFPPLQFSSPALLLDPRSHQSTSKNYSCSFMPLCFFACACLFPSLDWNFSPLKPHSRVVSFARRSQAKFITRPLLYLYILCIPLLPHLPPSPWEEDLVAFSPFYAWGIAEQSIWNIIFIK